jgi:hypothetical protein
MDFEKEKADLFQWASSKGEGLVNVDVFGTLALRRRHDDRPAQLPLTAP